MEIRIQLGIILKTYKREEKSLLQLNLFIIYIFINDYNILAIMMMMDDDIKEKQYQQEQRLFTFIIAYVVLIYIVISIS